MATVVRHEKYASVDIVKNSNKVWEGEVFDDGTFKASWGRVGGTMQSESKPFGSVDAANRYMDKKIAEKTKPKTDKATGMTTMYEKVETVDTKEAEVSIGKAKAAAPRELSTVAKSQIAHTNPIVAQLIDRLAKENIHQIVAATGGKLSYNDTTGLFSTPLGVVTAETITEARDLLTDLGTYVVNNDYDNDEFVDKMQRYMRRIPQDLGYGRITPQTVLPDLTAVQKQSGILDSLEASLKMVEDRANQGAKKTVKKIEPPKIFDVQLELLEDGKDIDRIRKLYRDTRKDQHVCKHLDVRRIFTVDIKTMREAFEPVAARLGTVKELWHGTRTCNVLSILKGGLVIPPSNAGHCTGRMFGNGAYFAIHSTKSLNYAYGYWSRSGGTDDNCLMFLANVALGKYCIPPHSGNNYPSPGYDSTWAQPGKSGIQNDEIIVPKINQCNLTYLVEFTPGGK